MIRIPNNTNVYPMHWNSLLQTFNVSNILRADGFSFVPPLCNQKIHSFFRRSFWEQGEDKWKEQKNVQKKKKKERIHTELWHVVKKRLLFNIIQDVQYIKYKHGKKRSVSSFLLNYIYKKRRKRKKMKIKRMLIRAYISGLYTKN